MTPPIVRSVESAPDPEELFHRTSDRPWTVWLDTSVADRGSERRYSFLACDPFRVLRGRGGHSEWLSASGSEPGLADPLSELDGALRDCRLRGDRQLPPFCGGAAGFLGYELARDLERLPEPRYRDLVLPDLEIAFYDLVIGWDRQTGECWVSSTGLPGSGGDRVERARSRVAQAEAWLAGGAPPSEHGLEARASFEGPRTAAPPTFSVEGRSVRSTFSAAGYRETVGRAIEYIRAGDIYQVNLSQRFEADGVETDSCVYGRLRRASPAPFGSFFRTADAALLSTSPERFLRVARDGWVETRPIKGTRPRDPDADRDASLAGELAASTKDRAENLMIADLLRNDLSRVCEPGSVRATDLFRVESYATVHHLVSTVEGQLRTGIGRTDLLRAAFPSGSVTGAPKIRAMEIISELEPVARGPYCGAIGYLGFGGDMDTSVSIRIAVVANGRAVFHAGGAVVADSDPAAEYVETLDKARALMSVFEGSDA